MSWFLVNCNKTPMHWVVVIAAIRNKIKTLMSKTAIKLQNSFLSLKRFKCKSNLVKEIATLLKFFTKNVIYKTS
jgi:hypothetical protein